MAVKPHFYLTLLATFLPVASCAHDGDVPPGPVELRVDAGNTASYKDQRGHLWEPDREYDRRQRYGFVGYGGDKADRGWNARILGTDDPRIYQTERWGMQEFVARVPNGSYTVLLHFVEAYEGIEGEGSRVFDVRIENHEVLKNFDIFEEAGGRGRAVVKEFRDIEVKDSKLNIRFLAKQQNPLINGIEILSQ
jgi:hypothetical protein